MAMSLSLVQEATHWRLSVSGDIGQREYSRFRMSVDKMLLSEPQSALVDLSGLLSLDSSGLGILIGMAHQHAANGRRLAVVTNGAVESLLGDARLQHVVATFPSVGAAMLALDTPLAVVSHSHPFSA